MLSVYIDFKSAASLLALAPTLELAERLGVQIDWRPFGTAVRDTLESGTDQAVANSHKRTRAEAMRVINIKYAKLRGIDLRYPAKMGAADLALGVLAEIEGDRAAFIEAAFHAYWQDHANLDDGQVVEGLIVKSGAQHSGDFSHSRAAFRAAQEEAEAAGVVGAPGYVIAGQLFIGREHLPWIEDIARADIG